MVMLLAVVMFIISYVFIRHFILENFRQSWSGAQVQYLNTASENFDLQLSDLGDSMLQLMWNADITAAIMVPDDVTYVRKTAIRKSLAAFEEEIGLCSRAYLVTFPNETVYDGEGGIKELKDSPQRLFFPSFSSAAVEHRLKDGSGGETIILTQHGKVAVLKLFPTPERNGALLVEVDTEKLFGPVARAESRTAGGLEVRDGAGGLLFQTGTVGQPGAETVAHTGKAGWTILSWPAPGQNELGTVAFLKLIGIWVAVFAVAGLAMSLMVSFGIYRPVGRLSADVAEGVPETERGRNELAMVRSVYENVVAKNRDLEDRVREMMPAVRTRLYKNLLYGVEMPADYLIDRLAYLSSPFGIDDYYNVMLIGAADSLTGEQETLLYGLYRSFSDGKYTSSGCSLQAVLTDDYTVVLILGFGAAFPKDADAAERESIVRYIRGFAGVLDESLVISCGQVCGGLTHLQNAYREAQRDMDYKRYNAGLSEEEQPVHERRNVSELLNLAANGDGEGAVRALETLLKDAAEAQNTAEERLKAVDGIMDRIAEALIANNATEEELKVLEPYYRAAESSGAEELYRLAVQTGTEAVELLCSGAQRSKNRYVVAAKKYIEAHCQDSRLSLESVADSVGINSAYLSRLFYEVGDVNFVNYVNGCRVERAKMMLTQTKASVQEIGFLCGFNSMQNFNRVFKRHTGTTAGAYRRQ